MQTLLNIQIEQLIYIFPLKGTYLLILAYALKEATNVFL